MSNTAEALFMAADQHLKQNLQLPIILQKCAERGHSPQNQAELDVIVKLAAEIGEGVLTGEIAPVPLSELESDGTLSKHASDKLSQDPMALSEEVGEIDVTKIDPVIKTAAAILCFGGMVNSL